MAEAAVGKRIKISKMQQHMMLAALGTSLIVGVSAVFAIYFTKWIVFNTQVIDEKDKSIANYYTAIKNVGICTTKNKDGKFSDKDLKECNPEQIDANELDGTLRKNVLIGMTEENNDLESVARDSQSNCYGENNRKIDFKKQYEDAASIEDESRRDQARENAFYMLKMCSSLRVVPDALPASRNDVALLSSMNQIFLLSGLEPEALAPSKGSEQSPVTGLETIPVTVSIKDNVQNTTKLLQNMERSIRAFSFQTAMISWREEGDAGQILELSAQALSFYTERIKASETSKTIYASKEAKKKGGSTGVKTVDDVVEEKTGMDTK